MAKNLKNKKSHLRNEERFCIEKMLKVGSTLKAIAKTLGRGESTICEEVKANGGRNNYTAEKAIRRAYWKQYNKKNDCNKVSMDGNLDHFVKEKLKSGWSPEVISSRLKSGVETSLEKELVYASPKSIRKFIKKRHGLERYLFWNRNNKKGGRKRNKNKYLNDPDRKWIDSRSVLALYEYGHWEMDFLVSKHSSWVLLVLVEKYSKKLLLKLLPNRNNDLVNKAVTELLKGDIVKTITTDNDIAFGKWKNLEKMLGTLIYFCHPYHSWEKGLVENCNRWIREFILKKTDLGSINFDFVSSIQDYFNHKPKVCLKGRTAYEVSSEFSFSKEIRMCDILVKSLSINFPKIRIRG